MILVFLFAKIRTTHILLLRGVAGDKIGASGGTFINAGLVALIGAYYIILIGLFSIFSMRTLNTVAAWNGFCCIF